MNENSFEEHVYTILIINFITLVFVVLMTLTHINIDIDISVPRL